VVILRGLKAHPRHEACQEQGLAALRNLAFAPLVRAAMGLSPLLPASTSTTTTAAATTPLLPREEATPECARVAALAMGRYKSNMQIQAHGKALCC
jgi:hypothetical protein